jgi:hypothetical protein
MLCPNCMKLAMLHSNKICVRCQGQIINNISVLCETCSNKEKQCSVCLKKIIPQAIRNAGRGCGCGHK